MSKISRILLILISFITFHISPFFPIALAAPKCSDQGVTAPNPATYLPNGNYILNIEINDDNTFNFLKNKEIRLHSFFAFQNHYTDPVTVTAKTIPLALVDPVMKRVGASLGANLEYRDSGGTFNDRDRCEGLLYTVPPVPSPPNPFSCSIDVSNVAGNKAPPNSILNFQFSGGTNTEYRFYIINSSAGRTLPPQFTAITTTDGAGKGIFLNIPLSGKNGEKLTLNLVRNPQGTPRCSTIIELSINAPLPGPLPSGPPPTPSPSGGGVGIICPGPGCSLAKGTLCDTDPKNPGIATAIGCVHTSPIGFTQDILKFAVAISGGIAFLMMLMGAFQMLTSSGNPETLKGGQDRLTSAIVGLLIVILAVILLRFIGVDILGIL